AFRSSCSLYCAGQMACRLRMERVTDRNGKGIGRIRRLRVRSRQLKAHHMLDLLFVRVAHTNDGFLDRVRGIFSNGQSSARRNQHCDAAGLTQFQGPCPIPVHESFLNRCGVGRIERHNSAKLIVQRQQSFGQTARSTLTSTIGNVAESRPPNINDAPSKEPEPWVDPDNPHIYPASNKFCDFFSSLARKANTG
ncbi:MAG: hypothetical protein ACI8TF_002006, partial [Paracoccaceae bacterium]